MSAATLDHDVLSRMLKSLKTTPTPRGACSTVPPAAYVEKTDAKKAFALMSVDMWDYAEGAFEDNRRVIKYAFIKGHGWSQKKEEAVEYTIKKNIPKDFQTWEDFAHVTFNRTHRLEDSDIRIAFQPGPSWSCVGKRAKYVGKDKPTLNLGWLKSASPPDADDRGTILHEFGHVLGMMHEHQSPARGEFIHLRELEVYRYYTPLLEDRATVKSQIIDTYNEGTIMNMSQLDVKSIMMYFMPGSLNEEGIDISVNTELSKLDKAFIVMNYPPPLKRSEDFKFFMQAMVDAGVSNSAAATILGEWHEYDGSTADTQPANVFAKMREQFSKFNMNAMRLRRANAGLANSVNTASLAQFGLGDFLGDVVNNKFFKSIMKNVIQSTLAQQGVPLKQTVPGANPNEVARMIAGLSMHPDVAEYVTTYSNDIKQFAVTPRPVY